MNLKTFKHMDADLKAEEKRKKIQEETSAANIASTVVPLGQPVTKEELLRWGQSPKRGDRKIKGA